MDKKRIFIAVPASEQFHHQAMRFSSAHAELPVRWLQPKDLHITIVPPIEVGQARFDQLVDQLSGVSGFKPFETHFETVEFGNDPNEPRLIWARGPMPVELNQLKGGVEKAIGYHPDRQHPIMHITLARFQQKQFNPAWKSKVEKNIHWNMLVDRFAIMESIKINGITQFPILKEFKL